MPDLELWRFSSFDLIRRRWVRARYVCALDRIGLDGRPFKLHPPPEVRAGRGEGESLAFCPWRTRDGRGLALRFGVTYRPPLRWKDRHGQGHHPLRRRLSPPGRL